MGEKLNVPATLSAITRTKIGTLSIKDTTTLRKLKNGDFSKGIIPTKISNTVAINSHKE